MAEGRIQSLMNMVRVHLNLEDLTPDQKKQSSLRVAKVLDKVLRSDRLDEATKERAKQWHKQAVVDPQINRMFRESSESDIEAFFQLPEEQQLNEVARVPKPAFTQMIHFFKMYPAVSWMPLLPRRHSFGWPDLVWVGVAIMVISVVMGM